jgi:hypothetical protein
MKGYGLSVFRGTTIERFDVEVVSILRNFNPKHDVVLVRCRGANLEHTGPISGMSGSPIYLKDDQGRERMIGAFAYGWPMMKDPIGGIQPIEYMLRLPKDQGSKPPGDGVTERVNGNGRVGADARAHEDKIRWSLSDVIMLPGMTAPPARFPLATTTSLQPNPRFFTAGDPSGDDTHRLQHLATPLLASGIPSRLFDDYAPLFKASGLTMFQAGGVGGAAAAADSDGGSAPLEPGSVLASPMLTGDVELTAVGTCTEVIGDRFVGFGHPFNNEGDVALPAASGEINTVVAKVDTSFKLGASTKIRGTITNDRMVGVGGKLGRQPPSVPIELRVVYTDGSQDQTYHFNAAQHSRLTPMLAAVATNASLTSLRDLPQYHTIDYNLKLDFANGETIELNNTAVNVAPAMIFMELALPMLAASENPFSRVPVQRVGGTIRITPEARQAQILSVNVPKLKYRPGETVKAFVTYRPFRAGDTIMPIDLTLPRDLPDGPYQLVVSDWQRFLGDEASSEPFRFTAENAAEVFSVIRDFTSLRHNAVYARLTRQADGVAIGRVAMPRLPSSRRQVLLGAGRSNTTPFVSSTTKTYPADYVMDGSAEFVITIDNEARVELGNTGLGGGEKAPRTIQKPETGSPEKTAPNPTEDKEKNKPSKNDKPEKADKADSEKPSTPGN